MLSSGDAGTDGNILTESQIETNQGQILSEGQVTINGQVYYLQTEGEAAGDGDEDNNANVYLEGNTELQALSEDTGVSSITKDAEELPSNIMVEDNEHHDENVSNGILSVYL